VSDDLDRVTGIVCRLARLDALDVDADIYAAGLTSVNALPLLFEIEDAFRIALPDDDFIQARTVRALHALVARVMGS
jgi:acyl carrier protein